ncbi:MAG: alpha/beta hydrolase [Burkholderiales bacterium]
MKYRIIRTLSKVTPFSIKMTNRSILITVLLLAWIGGCTRMPHTGITPLRPASVAALDRYLIEHKADLDQFRLRGPFTVITHENFELALSPAEHINTDLYLTASNEKAPLVILLHGLDSTKDDHTFQAMHLATWGIHCLAVQLPGEGPWVNNGKTLARIAAFVHRAPEALDSRIDANRIVLAGHSYGGSAVAIALASGAPAAGGILLDPAGIGPQMPQYLRRIDKPVIVLGADRQVSATFDRDHFYRYIRGGIAEVSIRDAAHEDAQYPSHSGHATEELQISFVSALTAAAFSLGVTGKFDYAWASFGGPLENGSFFGAKRK